MGTINSASNSITRKDGFLPYIVVPLPATLNTPIGNPGYVTELVV